LQQTSLQVEKHSALAGTLRGFGTSWILRFRVDSPAVAACVNQKKKAIEHKARLTENADYRKPLMPRLQRTGRSCERSGRNTGARIIGARDDT
jgi:hypothetical protein